MGVWNKTKRMSAFVLLAIMIIFANGCMEDEKRINSVGNSDAYNDAIAIIKKEYPNVTIQSTQADANIDNFSNEKGERRFAVVIVVDDGGKQQAIAVEIVYSGTEYVESIDYRVSDKIEVKEGSSSNDSAMILEPNTSMSKMQLYYLAVKAIADYYNVSDQTLLYDKSFPGVEKCSMSGAEDGGTFLTVPVDEDGKKIVFSCEIYEDRSCVIKNITDMSELKDNNTSENANVELSELDQIILDSDKLDLRYKYDLMKYSKEELFILRNGIFAKHGYIFESEVLKSYFKDKDYYSPSVTTDNWNDGILNDNERLNLASILACENDNDIDTDTNTGLLVDPPAANEKVSLQVLYCDAMDLIDMTEFEDIIELMNYDDAIVNGMYGKYDHSNDDATFFEIEIPGIAIDVIDKNNVRSIMYHAIIYYFKDGTNGPVLGDQYCYDTY